jgi:hypothetical protein
MESFALCELGVLARENPNEGRIFSRKDAKALRINSVKNVSPQRHRER